ncbi:hypothetical protein [Flammeovirga sp. EKP202]|uniref:hypothetical protein n=1 Tax=Flammeovirga sp. EKP202 TaxID=2770592 RepID=UPI00165FBDDF|nr:hypothetical protein [Flammeovirga sp. EKP202]MBD0403230.1 hypothetical protein [Flammeovirga sp. EKP202]
MMSFIKPILIKAKNYIWPKFKAHGLETILILFSTFLLCFCIYKIDKLQEEREKVKAFEKLLEGKEQKLETYTNINGDLTYQIEALKLSKSTMKEMYDQKEFQWLSKFENLKKKYQNLESAYQISLNVNERVENLSITDTVIKIGVDTVKVYNAITHKDKFMDLKVLWDSTKTAQIEYSVLAPVEIISYWERKWFLGKKKWKFEIVSSNENVKIKDAFSIISK